MALQPDDILDNKYRIIRLLGEGGMGAVYEGLNARIQRRVAIKVLHGSVKANVDAVQRFEREAQAAGRIGSKHIVQVLDLGDLPGGDRYMVMEYLDGVDLSTRIRTMGRMAPRELYPIAVQILEGLIAAHEAGIVHRDLKPDNIFLVPEGEYSDFVKILDFGISKFSTTGGEFSMTQTGVVMGTPYYMSPEQAKGSRDLDHRTDIYSLGVILYEALAGHVPYSAETFNALIIKIVLEDPPALEAPRDNAEADFHAIVAKAMARALDARYQTCEEFQGDLHDWARTYDIPLSNVVKRRSNFPPGMTKMHGTQRAWTQTTGRGRSLEATEPAPADKSSRSKLMAVAAVAAIVLAGVGFFVLRPTPSTDPSTLAPEAVPAASSAGVAEPEGTLAPTQPTSPAPGVAGAKPAASGAKPAASAPAPQEPPATATTTSADAPSVGSAEPTKHPKATAPSGAARPATKPAPTSAAAKPAPTKPATPSASGSTTSAGRAIRTEL